jgi:hypothetical protein
MSEAPKKAENLRANARPTDGYVLSIDGKLKARYETPDQAMSAALKLKESYPVIQVAIFNAAEQTYTSIPQDK